jgi:hypothetical protein
MTEPCSDIEDNPAAARIAKAIDAAEEDNRPLGPITNDPPSITMLGHNSNIFYFITRDGEMRAMSTRDMSLRLNIVSLFGGHTEWLWANFPARNKEGAIIPESFQMKDVVDWLVRKSTKPEGPGLFNPDIPLRRMGVWRSGEDVLAHLGESVWHHGNKRNAGCIIGGAIYTACGHTQEPAFDNPADKFEAQQIRAALNSWSFTQDHDADLLFGFLGASLLGGFPQWRVHALVTGDGGTGKSTLGRYLTDAIGTQGTTRNDYSEAGIRQSLTNEARMVWLDEGENAGEEQAIRMAKVIALLRKMSDGDGARIVRGSSAGTAINTTVTGCVLLTAINPPPLQPQDRSRILTVPLTKPNGRSSSQDIRHFRREAAKLSPRLRARALMGAERFAAAFDLYRKYLQEHGCDDRRADFFSTMLAGRAMLIYDEVPDESVIKSYVIGLRDRLRLIMIDDTDTTDGQICLNRLLDAECAAIRDGVKRSIGQVIAAGMEPPRSPENEKLVPIGLRIITIAQDGELTRKLFVANDHTGLRRIFHNTPWADGNWRGSLNKLPGVKPSPTPVSVGRKSRGLLLPAAILPTHLDDYDNVDPPPDPPDPVSTL